MAASAAIFALTGCGTDSNAGTPTPTPSAPATLTPIQKITALETSGTIPALNRTSGMLPNDVDSNGVRDDIDAYIASRPFTANGKRALTQLARGMQNSLTVDLTKPDQVNNTAMSVTRAINCVFAQASGEADPLTNAVQDIQSVTTNTKERLVEYMKYNKALDGSVSSVPAGDTCE
ncbi:hypothetical protein [Sphingomonas echinoides]|uniref:Lipoprotein n=1 Tax=Sphingomonas echinoides TaxID=59803 RepID=A0ABU4PND1_9SPHN|nr:hypothetical protein [Sphingomonas echinoides]MDX5984939.1 hypothetical protein [Sphingomonas echinoides]